jgi:hypothetical protein
LSGVQHRLSLGGREIGLRFAFLRARLGHMSLHCTSLEQGHRHLQVDLAVPDVASKIGGFGDIS